MIFYDLILTNGFFAVDEIMLKKKKQKLKTVEHLNILI